MPEKSKKVTVMKKMVITAVITVFLNIIIIYLGTLKEFHLGWAIGSTGIITFFGTLILTSLFNATSSDIINKTCIRKAITASFLTMYFAFVALLCFEDTQITDVAIIQPVISHFTYLVGLVVVFYFASSSISDYLNKNTKNNSTMNTTENTDSGNSSQNTSGSSQIES